MKSIVKENKNKQMVLVVQRTDVNSTELTKLEERLGAHGGTAGGAIVKKVLEGQGKALIPLRYIKLATDNIVAINLIFQNFDLYDAKTKTPLFYFLVSEFLKH
jgi:hypothetical protein